MERALLKRTKDRLLFKLGYIRKNEESHYEVLTDYDFNILEIWVYDIESKKVYKYTYEPSNSSNNKSRTQNDYQQMFIQKNLVNKENIKIGSDTYSCDHYKIVYKDDKGNEIIYEFWLTDKIPGKIVKYKFSDIKENSYLEATIVSVRYNYKIEWSDF
jgi:hypothetical protein